MMASFLPVIVSKKTKQTKKYVFSCSVSQIHINPEKTRKPPSYNDCLNLPKDMYWHKNWYVIIKLSQMVGWYICNHSVRHWRWSGGPRPQENMSDHQNIQTQWSDGPPKFSALSKIVTWLKNLSNGRHSRPIIQETQYRFRPFSRNKISVYNHAGHELLRSRLTIRSRPFYGTKDMCS